MRELRCVMRLEVLMVSFPRLVPESLGRCCHSRCMQAREARGVEGEGGEEGEGIYWSGVND